ncbi:hypothetical protein SBA4_3150041 [Candidatus Sulfopaludibacter sp. SbA4]|nr:hypothetical protein SBA4_3150041 [Candidatus Sulfopaludibacter sp. SbA4]
MMIFVDGWEAQRLRATRPQGLKKFGMTELWRMRSDSNGTMRTWNTSPATMSAGKRLSRR